MASSRAPEFRRRPPLQRANRAKGRIFVAADDAVVAFKR